MGFCDVRCAAKSTGLLITLLAVAVSALTSYFLLRLSPGG
jgi:hypothetical protein